MSHPMELRWADTRIIPLAQRRATLSNPRLPRQQNRVENRARWLKSLDFRSRTYSDYIPLRNLDKMPLRPDQVPISWKGDAGYLAAELTPPAAPADPVFLYIHGLGASRGGIKATTFAERAAEQGIGFCRFDLSCHGESTGSMREFTLERAIHDVATMLDWLASRGYHRVFAFGSSFGAMAALWHEVRQPGSFAGCLLLAPALGLRDTLEHIAGPQGMQLWRAQGWVPYQNSELAFEVGWALFDELGTMGDDALRELLIPLGSIGGRAVVMIHGDSDEIIPVARASAFASQLEAAGFACELRVIPSGNHALTDHRDAIWEAALGLAG